ncbi:hypothetical protein A3J61_01060 [Candidatus Nomurabacteria bacterium RIFCSPHIGHO2_02_FULL_38_15]|uniref:DUF5667 domain-containing protein n=1 Tax=Candidatus Nomurabacteria bacterium RIFCSPHIGHO2_02_FULL_38_15 TaxID=1801752 RepID=A0A1F6VSB6_9BACT|nr:MAG: hypothetical protein A3J61_01060 [Candidatus Nomurabacteria bacterium RIFCSPHIGHO2_02_FULL_38_15]
MKKTVFVAFAIMLTNFLPVLLLAQSKNSLETQITNTESQCDTLIAKMKISNHEVLSLKPEYQNLKRFYKQNKKNPEMQDSLLERFSVYNQKLSRVTQTYTAIVYDYNESSFTINHITRKFGVTDSVSMSLLIAYEKLKISSDFLDEEFKTFRKYGSRLDPMKSAFGALERRFAKL